MEDTSKSNPGNESKPDRVAKFKCPRVLDDQQMSEDNQKLRPGCPPDYQVFRGDYQISSKQIFQVIFPLPKTAA